MRVRERVGEGSVKRRRILAAQAETGRGLVLGNQGGLSQITCVPVQPISESPIPTPSPTHSSSLLRPPPYAPKA